MSPATDAEATVRPAEPGEVVDVLRIIEGALLDVDAERVRRGVERGDVLVAAVEGSVAGAIVLDPGGGETAHIEALAVARPRRDQELGTALVAAAADRYRTLTAEFRPEVAGFWTGLGFEVVERGDRLRGRRE